MYLVIRLKKLGFQIDNLNTSGDHRQTPGHEVSAAAFQNRGPENSHPTNSGESQVKNQFSSQAMIHLTYLF